MLKLKFVKQVPKDAVNISYVEPGPMNAHYNVSLTDLSYTRVENLSSYVGGEFNVNLGGLSANRVDTDEIVLSPRSVFVKGFNRLSPLYYKYEIGRSTYSIVANIGPGNLAAAKEEILKNIQILDRFDDKISGPDWDIEVTGADSFNNFLVTIYLNRRQRRNETFKIRYQAARRSDNHSFPNHIEVINAVPILEQGVDYSLQDEDDGYSIQGLASSNWSPMIGVFYNGALASGEVIADRVPPVVIVVANRLRFRRDDLSYFDVDLGTNPTVDELAQLVNESDAPYKVVALSDNALSVTGNVGAYAVPSTGVVLPQFDYVRVRYTEETRVRPLLPNRLPYYSPWYPRIDRGQFSQAGVLNGFQSHFIFKPQGDAVTKRPGRFGGNTHDVLDESPVILDDQIVSLLRPSFLPETLVLKHLKQDISDLVADYDQLNSIVFLSGRVSNPKGLFATYSYEEDTVVYTGIDLNPTGLNSQEYLGKYIGVYMTPAIIQGAWVGPPGPVTFNRTLWHVVQNDIPGVISAVESVKFDTGESAEALLLGIYRVSQPSTINQLKVTDTRTRGGGLREDVDPYSLDDAPEAVMLNDISLWNGEPFPPTAAIIEFPGELLGTGQAPLARNPQADPSGFYYPSGQLSIEDVQAKADKYKAGGVIAIVSPEDSLNA